MNRPPKYSPQVGVIRQIIAALCGSLITVAVVYVYLLIALSP